MTSICNLFLNTFSWSDAPLGIFPAGDMPAISLDVADVVDVVNAVTGVATLAVATFEDGPVGAATGLGTTGSATGTGAKG